MNRQYTKSLGFRMAVLYLCVTACLLVGLQAFWQESLVPSIQASEQTKVELLTAAFAQILEEMPDHHDEEMIRDVLRRMVILEDPLTNQPLLLKAQLEREDGVVVIEENEVAVETTVEFKAAELITTVDFNVLGTLRTYYNPAFYNTLLREGRQKAIWGLVLIMSAMGLTLILNLLLIRPLKTLALRLISLDPADPRPFKAVGRWSSLEVMSVHEALNGLLTSLRQVMSELQEQYQKNLESEQRFERAVNGTSDGLWEWDTKTNHLWMAPRFKHLLGFEEKELEDHLDSWQERIHPEDREENGAALAAHLEKRAPYVIELRMRNRQEEYRWFRVRGAAIFSKETVRISGSIQDITRQRVNEQERERLLAALEDKNKELEQVVYIASHDLRSPLVNVQGFSHELSLICDQMKKVLTPEAISNELYQQLEPMLFEDVPDALEFIKTSTSKMDMLLKGLLKLSRLGRAALQIEPLKMDDLIRQVISNFEYITKEQGIEIRVDANLPDCRGDVTQINQVFSNLISNAIKYRDPERACVIRVSAQLQNGLVCYDICDNGLGIPPNSLNSIFELFHRLHPNKSEGEGLGLTIVRKILERHGGAICVTSEQSTGSTFSVSLPSVTKTSEESVV